METFKTKKNNFNHKKNDKKSKDLKKSPKLNNQLKKKKNWMKNAGGAKLSPSYYDAAIILKQMYFKKGSINSLISKCKNQKVFI